MQRLPTVATTRIDLAAAFFGGLAGIALRNPAAIDFAAWSWTYRVGGEAHALDWGRLIVLAAGFAFADALALWGILRLVPPPARLGAIRYALMAIVPAVIAGFVLFQVDGMRPHNMPTSTLAFMAVATIALQVGWRLVSVCRPGHLRTELSAAPRTANAITLILGLALALALVEAMLRLAGNPLGLRVKGDRAELPVNVAHVLTTSRADLEPSIDYSRNAQGLRGPLLPSDSEFKESITILAIGGSTTEEQFVSDSRIWTAVLDQFLAAAMPRRWIGNAGISGHSTVAHQVLVEDFALKLAPKVALFLVGINDLVVDEGSASYDSSIYRTQMGEPILVVLSRKLETARVVDALLRYARAWRAGLTTLALERGPALALVEDAGTDGGEAGLVLSRVAAVLPAYRARLERLVETTMAGGVKPVLITQPLLWGEGMDPTSGRALGRERARLHGIETSSAVYWRAMEIYNDVTRAVGAERGVPVIDLARDMPKDTALYIDQMHYSAVGSRQVGAIIARDLCQVLAEWYPDRVDARACPGAGAIFPDAKRHKS